MPFANCNQERAMFASKDPKVKAVADRWAKKYGSKCKGKKMSDENPLVIDTMECFVRDHLLKFQEEDGTEVSIFDKISAAETYDEVSWAHRKIHEIFEEQQRLQELFANLEPTVSKDELISLHSNTVNKMVPLNIVHYWAWEGDKMGGELDETLPDHLKAYSPGYKKEDEKSYSEKTTKVRMTNLFDVVLSEEFGETFDPDKTVEIETIRTGTFKHKLYGDLKITKKLFDSFIENFKKNVLGREIAFDKDHEAKDATAWLKGLSVKNDSILIASVSLTELGFDLIKKKLRKFFSLEYTDDYVDKETGVSCGPTIVGGGFTNRPFIPGLSPITLSEDGEVFYQQEGDTMNISLANIKDIPWASVNKSNLPDSCFAYVKSMKSKSGKTLKIRKLPYKNQDGSINPNGVRAAVAAMHGARSGMAMRVPGAMDKLKPAIAAVNAWRKKKGLSEDDDFIFEVIDALAEDIKEISDEDRIFYEFTNEEVSAVMETNEKKTEETPTAPTPSAEPAKVAADPEMAKKLADQETAMAKMLADNEAMQKRLKELEEGRKAQDYIIFSQRVERDCDRLLTEGSHYPAVVNVAKRVLLSTYDSGDKVVKLADPADASKESEVKVYDAIVALMDAIPKEARVSTEEKTRSSSDTSSERTPAKDGKELSDADVAKFAKENNITFTEAVVELAKQGKVGDLNSLPPTAE